MKLGANAALSVLSHGEGASSSALSHVEAAISELAHWLPTQGPIKDFIHHNTLHAYQHRPFHEGTRIAAAMYGARRYLSLRVYREKYAAGEIAASALESILRKRLGDELEREAVRRDLFALAEVARPSGVAEVGLRQTWRSRHGINLDAEVHPTLFRLVGHYLDQGVSMWRMPYTSAGLFAAVRRLTDESWLPMPLFGHKLGRTLLALGPVGASEHVLSAFVGRPAHYLRYLTEMCLAHPGWSGMVHMLEADPKSLVERRQITLLEFCALELIAEYVVVHERLGSVPPLLGDGDEVQKIPAQHAAPPPTRAQLVEEVWHEALERTYADELIASLTRHAPELPQGQRQVQAFFCIDDRECSVRRHLEQINPSIETFGSAGFFGVDCLFQGARDAFPFKHCPAPVSPRHLIREVERGGAERPAQERSFHLEAHANTFVRGFLITQTLGFWSALKLAFSIFRPSLLPPGISALRRVDPTSDLEVAGGEQVSEEGFLVGYRPEEMADRVLAQLRSTGAIAAPLADLVVFLGHGASSVNNPYFAAYDCGACSGKAGGPNARAIAAMANRPDVREILAARGVTIPDRCWFVGGVHDTTRDEARFYDLELLPAGHRELFSRFERELQVAFERNAVERCKKLPHAGDDLSPKDAQDEVRRCSVAIFEPRPELNHASNAACVVGRRALTRGLFLDRRAFLQSYDAALDPQGDILAGILSAVVPVCGGINLEYFFSRVDPERYGAGSKLPHNVCGLIGVTNGVEGDLLTGLPTQMTEQHTPIRLSLVVEQDPGIALAAARRNPAVYEWLQNGWVRFFAVSPSDRSAFELIDDRMVPTSPVPVRLTTEVES